MSDKKRYRLTASSIRYYTMEVEAHNEEEAWDIADHSSENWAECLTDGDWQNEKCEEIK